MGLLTRMTTLFKADAHGVVDSIEDRSLLLKQVIDLGFQLFDLYEILLDESALEPLVHPHLLLPRRRSTPIGKNRSG